MNRFANALIGAVPVSWLEFASRNQWRAPRLRRVFAWGASLVKGRDGVIMNGVGKGLRFNTANSHSGFLLGSHETEVQDIFATVLKPGMVYYDVGANVGFFSIIAARLVGAEGRVFSFEPLPQNADQIAYNARLNGFSNVSIRREAMGGSDRTETFCTSLEPTWGRLEAVGKRPMKPAEQISVGVRQLDTLCGHDQLPKPQLMKIDVEGAEIEVLSGGLATLAASRPLIVMELHSTNDAICDILEKLNYEVALIGSSVPVREANWDAYIIAAPRERAEMVAVLKKFGGSSNPS
jgi:FkbM family methyltransferase